MRVVFDTNVWVSGSLTDEGAPARLVDRAINGEFLVFSSRDLYEELADVMWRQKIARLIAEEDRAKYLKLIGHVMIVLQPEDTISEIERDSADNRVLECAVEAEAQYIVSGDPHLLDLDSFRGISISNPRQFLNRLTKRNEDMDFPELF